MPSAPQESSRSELHPAVRIGHVHLRVADLERATSFYRDVLGFDVTAYGSDFGLPGAAFLAESQNASLRSRAYCRKMSLIHRSVLRYRSKGRAYLPV